MISATQQISPNAGRHQLAAWLAGFVCPSAVATAALVHMSKGNRRLDYAHTRGSGMT